MSEERCFQHGEEEPQGESAPAYWQCAERGWRCGVKHGSYEAARNHIRRMGRGASRWRVIPWQPLTVQREDEDGPASGEM